jgi:hypothetical protein
VEVYGIDPSAFSSQSQRDVWPFVIDFHHDHTLIPVMYEQFACSATTQTIGTGKGESIVIQGNVQDAVVRLLQSKHKIPLACITSVSPPAKKKKP